MLLQGQRNQVYKLVSIMHMGLLYYFLINQYTSGSAMERACLEAKSKFAASVLYMYIIRGISSFRKLDLLRKGDENSVSQLSVQKTISVVYFVTAPNASLQAVHCQFWTCMVPC